MSNAPKSPGARPKVLVCNDEPVMHDLVRATLDRGLYTMVEAHTGEEALTRSRSELPDLIVLDVMMPKRSGSDVLSVLRRCPRSRP